MADEQRTLTPSAIKYLLALLDLCQNDAGARLSLIHISEPTRPY